MKLCAKFLTNFNEVTMNEYDKKVKRLCNAIVRLRKGKPISKRAAVELGHVEDGVILALPESDIKVEQLALRGIDEKTLRVIECNKAKVQKLHFELMRIGLGTRLANEIISDLNANKHLWCAAMTKRQAGVGWVSLIDLRDMPRGFWNVRNLWIYASGPDCSEPLRKFADKWDASAFKFMIDPHSKRDGCDLGTSELAFVAWYDWG